MSKQTSVDEFMRNLDHPFKTEVQALRGLILDANKEIAEEIKWNAPSFSFRGDYLVTFNLWEKERIHLVFHHPEVPKVQSTLLEGKYDRRRMAYFTSLEDIRLKRFALQKVLKDLIRLQKKKRPLPEIVTLEE